MFSSIRGFVPSRPKRTSGFAAKWYTMSASWNMGPRSPRSRSCFRSVAPDFRARSRFALFPAFRWSTATTFALPTRASAMWLPMKPAPPVITIFDRAIPIDTTRGAYSRFLRTTEMREEGGHRPRPVGDAVLLRHHHLREGLRRSLGDENRIESEAALPSLLGRDRPSALSVEDVVGLSLPEQEDGLERRGTRLCVLEEFQEAGIAEAFVHVRRIHAGKATERVQEEARVVDEIVSPDLVVEDRRGETHDLLEAVCLDLRITSILVHQLHARIGEDRGHFAVLACIRRDEGDHV